VISEWNKRQRVPVSEEAESAAREACRRNIAQAVFIDVTQAR